MLYKSDHKTSKQLNKEFSYKNGNYFLHFKNGPDDIPVIEINNMFASATISLQGAHVLSWKPVGEKDVIWLSDDATFATGKSVRGGIPVCWPWFGAHESEPDFPAHGFARTVLWQVTEAQQLTNGETQVSFKLDTQLLEQKYQQMWPQSTVAEYHLRIGKTLRLELSTFNNSAEAVILGQALHTYFNVSDVSATTIEGLADKDYLDKTDGFVRKKQSGLITIDSEVDRVYLNTADDVVINDQNRNIMIKKQGSLSTVVWNPWKEVADKMADLGQDGYLTMLCVESANAAEDTINIPAGGSHSLNVSYEIKKK